MARSRLSLQAAGPVNSSGFTCLGLRHNPNDGEEEEDW